MQIRVHLSLVNTFCFILLFFFDFARHNFRHHLINRNTQNIPCFSRSLFPPRCSLENIGFCLDSTKAVPWSSERGLMFETYRADSSSTPKLERTWSDRGVNAPAAELGQTCEGVFHQFWTFSVPMQTTGTIIQLHCF